MIVADLDRLPAPYPGELWYSIVARDVARAGYSQREFRPRMALGGLSASINIAYPNRVHRLLSYMRGRSHLDPVAFAREHTLLPYLLAFDPATRLLDLLRAGAASDRPLSKALGSIRSPLNPSYLRYCYTCRHEDRIAVGEPYWHTAHQVPFVVNCCIHGDRLLDSLVPYEPRRHEFWTAHDVLCTGKALTKATPGMELSNPLVREIGTLSLRAQGAADLYLDSRQYADILKSAGFRGDYGDVASTRVANSLTRFIASHGGSSSAFGRNGWWRGLYTQLARRLRPIQHVTMRLFLREQLWRAGPAHSHARVWEDHLMGSPS